MPTRKYQIVTVNLDQWRGEFAVFPSAQDKIKHDLNQAVAKNTITDERERSIAERALLAAAIEIAHKEGTRMVKAAHVRSGWGNLSIAGPGCNPPRSCIRRSVIERLDEIKERSHVFREMMLELE